MTQGGFERFKISAKGAKALLRSDDVRDDLERRARAVKNAAEPNTDRSLIADSYTGKGRAGATVIGVSIGEERKRRVLGGAMDAARQ